MKKYITRDIWHVVSVKDKYAHKMQSDCHCKPIEIVGKDYIQVIHNSFDFREFVEDCGRIS